MYRGDAIITRWTIKQYALANNGSNTDVIIMQNIKSRHYVGVVLVMRLNLGIIRVVANISVANGTG